MPTYPLTGTADATVEARLAVMRLAQTRLGYMDPVLRLTIAGTDRATKIIKNSIRITRTVESPSTASFTVFDIEPVEGQEVKIAIGAISNVLFAGHITKVSVTLPANSSLGTVRYSVQCQDYSWLANRRQVLRQYASDNVDSILADLIASFTTGFTTSHVQGGLGFLTGPTPFTMEQPDRCVRRLAKEVNAYAYWDPVKDLHFFTAGQDRAPQPHALTTAYTDFDNVRYSVDLSQIVTRIYVEGRGSTLTQQWNLGNLLLEDSSMFPATGAFDVRVGPYAPVNGRRLRYTKVPSPPDLTLSVAGDTSYSDLIAMTSSGAGTSFPIGTEVNLWLITDDTTAQTALAALEGGDGVHEAYVQDRRLTLDGMTERANAELNRRKNPIETITYRTHDPNTRPGAQVSVTLTINLPTPVALSGTFTIQSVTISDVETADFRHPWYEVTATSDRRTLWDLLNAIQPQAA